MSVMRMYVSACTFSQSYTDVALRSPMDEVASSIVCHPEPICVPCEMDLGIQVSGAVYRYSNNRTSIAR